SHIVLTTSARTEVRQQAPQTIRGIVSDISGAPLVGVTVLLKGTTRGVTTVGDGGYSIQADAGSVLQFSYLGYSTKEVTVAGGASVVNVTLEEAATIVDQVVVTALGIRRQEKTLSYNVQQVKAEELTNIKDANFMNSLVGKVAGVTINSSATGAGGAARVVMRGTKSLNGSNNALYVIDGIPMFNVSNSSEAGLFVDQPGTDGAADINPEDIESITMLTGPSAAALYGAEAASGVVLINTRKGTKDQTTVSYSNSTTFSTPYVMPEMQNRYVNVGGQLESWGARQHSSYDPKDFFNTSANIINSVVFTTGTQRNQTYASASSTNTTGIIPNTKYDRYNFTFRNTASFLKDRMSLDLGANYIIQNDRNMTAQGQYQNPLLALYLFPRGDSFDEVRNFERYNVARGVYEQYWPYTNAGLSLQNPYWIAYRNVRENSKKRYMLNATLKYQLLDWLDVTARARVDNTTNRYTYKKYATTDAIFASEAGAYDDRNINDQSFYGDVIVNINKSWDKWSLMTNIGASINDIREEMIGYSGNLRASNPNLFAVHNLDYTTKFKPKQEGWHDQVQSVFASAEVGWNSMLYLTVTGRNEWDSRLAGSKHSSFFYPSVGLSGIISRRVDLPGWITFLKVRGSYSEVANAFDRYMTIRTFEFSEEAKEYETTSRFPIYDLMPERTKSWEVGVNARFLNKISFDFTYYRSNTTKQLFNIKLSGASGGWSELPIQSGDIQNQGIEMGVGYNNKWGDVYFSTHYNFTWNKNKVVRLADGQTNPITGEAIEMTTWERGTFGNLDARIILKEGGSMGDVYASHVLATDANGNIKVDPQKGTLEMEAKDVKLGSILPDYNMGWNNTIAYKDIQLGFT
ncbi:MAG: SusC/RagA family TonB-linked outer membrane protein, partial [Alistipes sp.]|nr:SusC/RagA family TonB-linked outer membrane protein [Alistipes sp.]